MIDTIMGYFYIIMTAIGMMFVAWFKLRGAKIKDLEQEVANDKAKDNAQDFEADNRVAKAKAEAEDVKDTYADGSYSL